VKLKGFFFIVISAIIVFVIGTLIVFKYGELSSKEYESAIKSHPKMYAYQTYWGPPNSVFIIVDLKYKDQLVKYYDRASNGENPIFNFPLKTLPQHDPVYVIGYTSDSLLAEVVSYYDRGRPFGGNYLRGYVYAKTLHDKPYQK
jgi:hypothetical protein